MAQLDLDDLPPKIAARLAGLCEGEELVLVQHGAVVARLTAAAPPPAAAPEPEPAGAPGQRMAEVFEDFRAAVEDEF